ncbi:transglycosylase domain-containing protein [Virgisporangium ochraceum]|nr:transglycosylase domain-containing protein [Virgisporangium ochraceum]
MAPVGPGGPGGPTRPDGPAAAGQGGRAQRGPRPPRSKKARRRNWAIASIAVLIMVAGGTLVGGTYVFAKIPAPDALPAGQTSTIYFSDGATEMAKIGRENRTIVALDKIPKHMQHAVIATEDQSFYSNEGVDVAGIVRAAWNNFTGGERQGASTITQQYARKIAELTENSYKRKVEEAAVAMKLADKYTKDEILGFYLNTVYFGRSAYGVEAAAKAYFDLNSAMELTVEQSIMLAGFIKNPDGGGGSSAFDPNVNPNDAKARFEANRNSLVELKPKLAKYGSDAYQVTKDMQMPAVPKFDRSNRKAQTQFGLDTPTGHIVHNVMDELTQLQKTDRNIKAVAETPEDLKDAGLKIVTTIDLASQGAAQTYADVTGKDSPLKGIPATQTAALVAVEPFTGRVLAYYGGNKGSDLDYAGSWVDPVLGDGQRTTAGFHAPASSFKIYTLAAALSQGISINSWWDGRPRDFDGRPKNASNGIRNANAEGDCAKGSCQLWEMTAQSLNVPFYQLTTDLDNKAAAVLETARAAGVRYMRDVIPGKGAIWDLNAHKATELANTGQNTSATVFDIEIGFGQYPITVIDHANGVASLAAGGQAAKAHFIAEIYKDDKKLFTESLKLTAMPGFTSQMGADMAWTLEHVAAKYNWNPKDRKVAAKTGTWENGNDKYKGQNAHSWTVGYSPANKDKKYNGVAVAVWVGNKGDELPIKQANGEKMQGSSGAGKIFDKFIKKVSEKKPTAKFAPPKFVGDEDAGDGKSPTPSTENNQSQGNPGPGGGNNNPGPGGGNATPPGGGPGGGGGGGGNRGGRD